ncbi:sarcosine oxidase [Aspergillus steynii IBT 23096]|uniref:Sarcosine oxidase n=1 Tax=Aspergillus steynii IBT 23096 TaxID=1392250 RepID=A0A2I2G4I9_9EURO|nr:sarcosine oxidase [Aspergillus steynii IBT 23096]PLB47791.1 sarcosine oxidase [Aspergillus steynii IBT 23096]
MQQPKILIVGAGAFGLSTAYHLSLRGYKSVTVVNRFETPSKDSAATDLNKVLRTDYADPAFTKLAVEAMAAWKDPNSIFAGMYHESGWIMAANTMSTEAISDAYQRAEKAGLAGAVDYVTPQTMRKRWPAGAHWGFSRLEESVPSGKALMRMNEEATANGVISVSGPAGHIVKLVYGENGVCRDAIAADGTFHQANIVILASGANTATLVDVGEEVTAACSAVVVIKLEPHEIEKYRIPIIDNMEQGIIFPPDEDGFVEICSCRGITNYQNSILPRQSILHSVGNYPEDGCPKEIESELRTFVREMMPELAHRPFVSTELCWDAFAPDSSFRICPYPQAKNLFVATVGSGHAFKFLPTIRKNVVDMVEGNLDPELERLWAWKYGESARPKAHPYPSRDLGVLTGWKGRNAPASGKLPWTWSRL